MGFFSRFQIPHDATGCHEEKEKQPEGPQEPPPGECLPKKIRIPLNKTTTDVRKSNNTLIFSCPICESLNSVPVSELHPIIGGEPMCQNCQTVLHVPGGYRTDS